VPGLFACPVCCFAGLDCWYEDKTGMNGLAFLFFFFFGRERVTNITTNTAVAVVSFFWEGVQGGLSHFVFWSLSLGTVIH